MEPRFSSPFGQGELYATINECLPPPPLLPPPNQDVRDCKIDCTEMSDDTPLNAVNPESEHFRKSLTVDMNCPVPRQTEPSFTTVSTSVFWEPAKTEETLYDQLAGAKVRVVKRSNIQLEMVLGSGQFGTVEKGIWNKDDGSSVVVAVKKLKSETEENRIKFLREAAIMSQFKHNNVSKMYGVVLSGNPMMIVVEILPKGDLKEFLSTTRYDKAALTSDFAARLLQMSRDVAAGMTYLAGLSFIHRDLAARNVLLDKNLVCKIADFGLARDLDEKNCYIQSQKGHIPIRWTALEALSFFKYSLASDVWSYGVVLYEIWSVGERPYGYLPNKMVVENVEMGFRLPPPPGCPYAIYELMIECWNPDYHKRPAFGAISTRLSEPDDALLINEETLEPISGKIGDCLEDSSQTTYLNLQSTYRSQ
ncbi:ephrin type-A receptor 4a-like isoform X2 [Oscarella lobularis]|uniref:ephrin type-A receptor 4a-like isoform X2 n=1 Tax=Oscarella lobularis TaxID=121494 RepID=UPI0033139738